MLLAVCCVTAVMMGTAAAVVVAASLLAVPTAGVRGVFTDDLRWVRGVNYVPSTAHNDMGIWLDYNSTLVHQELGYAGATGFNAVRIFLHWLAWDHDEAAFLKNIEDFLAAADSAKLKVLFVVLMVGLALPRGAASDTAV
eukprot:COSAG01_NODE_17679_length_1132_cov_1.120039_3_plen_140_part_00